MLFRWFGEAQFLHYNGIMNFIEKADKLLEDIKAQKVNAHLPAESYRQKDFLKDLNSGEYQRAHLWIKSRSKNPQFAKQSEIMDILFDTALFDGGFGRAHLEPWSELLKELSARKIIDLNAFRPVLKEPYWLTAFSEMRHPEIWLNLVKIGADPLLRWKDNKRQEYTLWRAYGEFFNDIWTTDQKVPVFAKESYERQMAFMPPDEFTDNLFWRDGSIFSMLGRGHIEKLAADSGENQGFLLVKEMLADLLTYVPVDTWPTDAMGNVQQSILKSKRPAELLSFWVDQGMHIKSDVIDALPPSSEKSALLEKILYLEAPTNGKKSPKVKV